MDTKRRMLREKKLRQIRARKNRESKKKELDAFEEKYFEEINKFYELFKTEDDCIKRLMEWRKWKIKSKTLEADCPKRGCNSERAYIYTKSDKYEIIDKKKNKKIEKENKKQIYQCMDSECRYQFSLTSKTVFSGTRTPLWVWFLAIYSMGILDGEIPLTFLMKKAKKFVIDNGIKRNISKRLLENMAEKISKNIFQNKFKKNRYLRLVGLIEARSVVIRSSKIRAKRKDD